MVDFFEIHHQSIFHSKYFFFIAVVMIKYYLNYIHYLPFSSNISLTNIKSGRLEIVQVICSRVCVQQKSKRALDICISKLLIQSKQKIVIGSPCRRWRSGRRLRAGWRGPGLVG